jgi:hypothetical protein
MLLRLKPISPKTNSALRRHSGNGGLRVIDKLIEKCEHGSKRNCVWSLFLFSVACLFLTVHAAAEGVAEFGHQADGEVVGAGQG